MKRNKLGMIDKWYKNRMYFWILRSKRWNEPILLTLENMDRDLMVKYTDYLIESNPDEFAQVGFIGKGGVHNVHAKWWLIMKVMQFGEGNFLRSFVDLYLDTLNKEDGFNYEVTIVKSIKFGSVEQLRKQNGQYHVVLRGRLNDKNVEDVYRVDSVKDAFGLYEEQNSFFKLAEDQEVKIIVSNTTEAGIVFNKEDKKEAFPDVAYPAKLALWLYHRYKSNLSGVYILPV